MAKTNTRKRTRSTPRPATRMASTRGPARRRSPWQQRPTTWAIGVAVVGLGAAGILLLGGGDDPSAPGRPFVGGDFHSLVADPASASRLFVGGHEGVATSTDGGRTWRQVESLAGADAMGWAFTEEGALVGGHPGLFVSDDGGSTFRQSNDGLPATDIHALGSGTGVIYAASPAVGVFASSDRGASWELRTDQVGQSFMGSILVDPEDPDHLVAPDMQAGAVESSDGGRTWSALGGVGGAMWVSWDPADIGRIVVSAIGQAAMSRDGGRTWERLPIPEGVSLVEIDPDAPDTLYAGALEGTEITLWISRDGGDSWSRP